tara:strand:- start:294 stop:428 length:135 start_codon:yes stop_codon:yes gene_type:complete
MDPRNFEEFYYGKGKENRKVAHLSDDSDNERIKDSPSDSKVTLL